MVQQRQQKQEKNEKREEKRENKNEKRENKNRVSGGAKKTKKSGEKKMRAVGSRAEVWHYLARATSGGLTRKDITMNKWGRLVSKKMSIRARKEGRLRKAGFIPKKGVFKLFKKSDGKKKARK
jgi:DVNP family